MKYIDDKHLSSTGSKLNHSLFVLSILVCPNHGTNHEQIGVEAGHLSRSSPGVRVSRQHDQALVPKNELGKLL